MRHALLWPLFIRKFIIFNLKTYSVDSFCSNIVITKLKIVLYKYSTILLYFNFRWKTLQMHTLWKSLQSVFKSHHSLQKTYGIQTILLWKMWSLISKESWPSSASRNSTRRGSDIIGRMYKFGLFDKQTTDSHHYLNIKNISAV